VTGPTVVLRVMTDDERIAYRDHAIEGYVTDLVRAGALDESAARLKAVRDYRGLAANDQAHWRHVVRDGEVVGALIWVVRAEDDGPVLFLDDIEIFEEHRGRGCGRAAMNALTVEAANAGAQAILLNVWSNNDVAQSLYDSMGFVVTNCHMRLDMSPR